jgi:hypothetical protein
MSLQNNFYQGLFEVTQAHAGGIGGIVNGAYVLLRKEILAADLDPEPSEEVIQYLLECLPLTSSSPL